MSRYQFIEQVAATEPVQVLCRVLEVSVASYYQWRRRAARPLPSWELAATAAFSRYAQRYGTRCLRAELRAEGHAVGRYALRTWLRRRGLRALSTRPQRPRTTVADPATMVVENLLLGQPVPTPPNHVWVGDSTPTLTWTGGTPRWATARPTNSNATFKSAYLSALSVSTGPPHIPHTTASGQCSTTRLSTDNNPINGPNSKQRYLI